MRRKKRQGRPTIRFTVAHIVEPPGTPFRDRYGWRCPWCGEEFQSPERDKVNAWTIRHLNHHLRQNAATRTPAAHSELD
jgi:hypothetical protein